MGRSDFTVYPSFVVTNVPTNTQVALYVQDRAGDGSNPTFGWIAGSTLDGLIPASAPLINLIQNAGFTGNPVGLPFSFIPLWTVLPGGSIPGDSVTASNANGGSAIYEHTGG